MTKILLSTVAIASGIALTISMAVNAHATQMLPNLEREHTVNKRAQLLQMNVDLLQRETDRLPLMLPQPTKIDRKNKYAIG